MCKIFTIVGIQPTQVDKAQEILIKATSELTERDNDGFGYVEFFPEKGAMFGERWLNPKDAWRVRGSPKPPKDLEDTVVSVIPYTRINRWPGVGWVSAIVAHARMSTSGKGLANVHPFVRILDEDAGQIALVHNGIVRAGPATSKLDTTGSDGCDSAGILNAYVDAKVHEDPHHIQEALDKIAGSYACVIMGKLKDSTYVDIFRNDTSKLSATKIKNVGTVWCTEFSIVHSAVKKLNDANKTKDGKTKDGWAPLEIEGSWSLKPDVLVRLDAVTGAVLNKTPFRGESQSYISHQGGGRPYWRQDKEDSGRWHQTWMDRDDYKPGKVDVKDGRVAKTESSIGKTSAVVGPYDYMEG